jgi:predicted cupin superfamily sugar epimerase
VAGVVEARQRGRRLSDARALIETLGLAPHPEGGWYRETWRADAPEGGRAAATAILFLLEEGQSSHWHKVDATELWLFHAGSALCLRIAPGDDAAVTEIRLGADIQSGEMPQLCIPPHHWQAAEADGGWALVSCIVSPGFDFAGFTLAPPGWAPGRV